MTKLYSQPVCTLIEALNETLFEASHLAHVAREAIQSGQQNEAIGTLLPVVDQLETSTTLLRATLALHRRFSV